MKTEECVNRELCGFRGCRKILLYEIDKDGYILTWICPSGHKHPKPTYRKKNTRAYGVNHSLNAITNGSPGSVDCPICSKTGE